MTRQRLPVIDKSHLSLRLSVYIRAIGDEVTARIAKASVAFSVVAVYTYIFNSSSLVQMDIDMLFTETSLER